MKKVLSITLTLAMLLGTFLMLVPTASAAEAASTTGGIYYANDFDDVTATDIAGILASIGWKTEKNLAADTKITVEEGRLIIDASMNATNKQEAFIIIENNEALKNGYVVDFDMEMIAKAADAGNDSAVSVHSSLGVDYTKREGRHGWIGQVRWNTNILAGAEDGTGWKPAVNGTPQAAKDTYLKKADETVATTMEAIRVAVRVAYDKTAETIKTYVKAYDAGASAWAETDLMQTATPSTDAGKALLTDDCRLIIYKGLKVAIDNMRIGTAAALDVASKDVIYSQNFDAVTGADTAAVLAALGWSLEVPNKPDYEADPDSENSVAIVDGRLVVDAKSEQQGVIILENLAKLTEGYIIECDIEVLGNGAWKTVEGQEELQWDPVGGPNDNCVGFHTMLGDWTVNDGVRNGRQGWISQIRAYAGVLAGAEDGTGWKNVKNMTERPWFVAMAAEGTAKNQLAVGNRINWRAEFDKASGHVKAYAKPYAAGEVTWATTDLQADADESALPQLLTDDLRLVVYKGMKVAIDNLVVFQNVPAPVPVNGEMTALANGAIDLADYCDGEFSFAVINGTQVVTESGYNMDAYVTSIDVYSAGVSALKGASIRTTDQAGLRFRTNVNYDALAALKTAGVIANLEIGTLTIDYETLGALGQLKLDTEGATKVVAAETDIVAYGDGKVVNCVIDVAADKLNTKYAATGYVIITFNDGSTLEIVAKYDKYTQARSVAEIAQTLTFDENHGLSAAQLQVVNTYAAAYVAD